MSEISHFDSTPPRAAPPPPPPPDLRLLLTCNEQGGEQEEREKRRRVLRGELLRGKCGLLLSVCLASAPARPPLPSSLFGVCVCVFMSKVYSLWKCFVSGSHNQEKKQSAVLTLHSA